MELPLPNRARADAELGTCGCQQEDASQGTSFLLQAAAECATTLCGSDAVIVQQFM